MVLCSIALHANVVTGTCGDNLTWSYDTDTKALTIEGTGDMYDYDFWSANQPWAIVKGDILSVSLPDGLTSIGSYAFQGCSALASITIPNFVTSIGWGAFQDCSVLTSIFIPNSVTSIRESAFQSCSSLTSIILPNSVTSIRGAAFENCSALKSITIPNSVTSIGGRVFSSCSQVIVECTTPPTIESSTFRSDASIFVPCSAFDSYLQTTMWQFLDLKGLNYTVNLSATEGGTATITATDCDANTATIEATSSDNCLHFVQWSDGITDNPRTLNLTQDTTLVATFAACDMGGKCGDNLTWSYDTDTKALTIEGSGAMTDYEYDNQPWAQVKGDILSVSLPEGLTIIGDGAFWECSSLTSIILSNSVTSIGDRAFSGCSSLTSIILPNSVTSIEHGAFADCSSLTSIILPNSVTSIGSDAFWGCSSLTSITIPNSVTSMGGSSLFCDCSSLTSVTLGNSVTSIGDCTFRHCSALTSITIPNSVTSIGWAAFEGCSSLTSVIIGNSVTSIGDDAFWYCTALTSVTLGNSVTTIGGDAFGYCPLTSITIPNSVTSIGDGAFLYCSQVIVECTTPPTIKSGTFNSGASIFVPCSASETYLQTAVWQFLDLKGLSHTINLSATEGGKATITATDCDANTATIRATSDECMHFVQWSDGNTDNPRIVSLTQDTTLVAQFESRTYQVNIYAGENGFLRVGSDWYYWDTDTFSIEMTDCGNELTTNRICAYPDDGYYFAGWSDGSTEQCRTFTITQDTTIVANFEKIPSIANTQNNPYTIEEAIALINTGIPYKDSVYVIGIVKNIYVSGIESYGNASVSMQAGNQTFKFYRMLNMGGKPFTSSEELSALFTAGDTIIAKGVLYYYAAQGTYELAAGCYLTEVKKQKTHSVTLKGIDIYCVHYFTDDWGNSNNETLYGTTINLTVKDGNVISFHEYADCGTWLGWSDGVTDYERTITITSDTVITSLFDVPTYQVSITAGEHGSLTQYGEPIGNIETTMTDCNSNGEWINSICAVPDEGYYFTGWSDGYADACRSIKVVSDTTLVAHFAEKQQVQVLVGVESACKNMGTVSGSGIFYQGDVVTITATPKSGYHFVEWSDNGDSHATRDILLTSDTTLFATFSAGDFGGKCGDNLYWTWDNGALTITGSGDMDLKNHPAWWQYPIDIQSVSFPEAMTSISAYAFYGYNSYTVYQAPYSLKEAIIPANVTYIGYASFAGCPQLTKWQYNGTQLEVQYAEGYGYDVFNGDEALTFLQAPAELVEYRNNSWSNLDTLIVISGEIGEVPSNVRYLDLRNATNSTLRLNGWENLTTLYLPNGSTEIADKALLGCKHLGGILIPADVTRIGESAFEDCRSMDSVVFAGNKVEEIGAWAFYNCHSLRSLTLPEGVEEVGLAAFYGCTYLNELTIPSTMKKIADNGFAGCEKMQTMYVNALVPPTIEAKTFEDVNRATPVFVPKGTLERYQADEYWSEFFNMAEYEAPTGNLNTAAEDNGLRKVVRNGQVLIIRGDKTYTILGEAL